jgi:thymidylate kinase
MGLISRLAEQFHTQGIRYCHWKSNINLDKSFKGEADLDFFVDRQSISSLLGIMTQLGFKDAKIRYGPEAPGVTHHYGLDVITGKFVHVHLFTNILTGESFVKSHRFPFERMFLENCYRVGQLEVVSKPAELVLFVLRMFIKHGSLLDMLRIYRETADIRRELEWLLDNDNIGEALSLLQNFCPTISESLFLNCVEAIHENQSFLKKLLLAQRVRWQLRNLAQYNYIKRAYAYYRVIIAKLNSILKGNLKNKTLHSGGAVIAFVGADATGKSTLVAETERWLGKIFAVRKVHVGKPPSSLLTVPFNMTFTLVRRLIPQLRRSQLPTRLDDIKPSQSAVKKPSSLIYAIRAVTLAWDRYKLLRKVSLARAKGDLVICDRYPSEQTGAMDSPRLEEHLHKKGMRIDLFNLLARLERKIYKRMPLPDIVIKLTVSLATAKKRNTERLKGEKDTDEFIEARHRSAHEWHKAGAKYNFEINTDQSMSETILNTKKVIWESL